MSDINTYHKKIYEDYLVNSHKWMRRITRIESVLCENNYVYVIREGDLTGCIIVAIHVSEDVERICIHLSQQDDQKVVTVTWSEEEIPLEKLLAGSKSLPILTSVEDIDKDAIPSNFKVVYPYEPFLYIPARGTYEVIPLTDNDIDICYVEYYSYCGEKVDFTFPHSLEEIEKYLINEDMTILAEEVENKMYWIDQYIVETLHELDRNLRRSFRKEDYLIMELDISKL